MSNPNIETMKKALNDEILPELNQFQKTLVRITKGELDVEDSSRVSIYEDISKHNLILIRLAHLMNDIITSIGE